MYTTSKGIIDIIGNLGIFDLRNPVETRCIDLAVLEIWRVGGRGHDSKSCHPFSTGCEFFLHRIQQCLRKQLTFYDHTTGFPLKWLLSKDFRNSILMTHHYPDLASASDWLKQISRVVESISSPSQIWVLTRHQYGISSKVSWGNSGKVTKCQLFPQAMQSIYVYIYIHNLQDPE